MVVRIYRICGNLAWYLTQASVVQEKLNELWALGNKVDTLGRAQGVT